jgi:hypothetical protein
MGSKDMELVDPIFTQPRNVALTIRGLRNSVYSPDKDYLSTLLRTAEKRGPLVVVYGDPVRGSVELRDVRLGSISAPNAIGRKNGFCSARSNPNSVLRELNDDARHGLFF